MRRHTLSVSIAALTSGAVASGALNEFSVADGYMSPFATSTWTYNPFWTLESSTMNGNYVAQHGYGSGGAFAEPFGLVIRNDNPAGNYRWNYQMQSSDLGGLNPAALSGQKVALSFDSRIFASGSVADGQPMVGMAFGGTRANPAVSIGFSDSSRLMYSDASNNLTEYTGYNLASSQWSRINITFDFNTFTYDLSVDQLTGASGAASATWTPVNSFTIVTGQPFATNVTELSTYWFETFTDPETQAGWHKWFIDNFDSAVVPAPGAAALFGLAGLGLMRRRR